MFTIAHVSAHLHKVARSVLPATSGATTPVQISQAIKESHEKKHNISKQQCNQRVCSMYHDFLHFQSPDELIVYCELKSRMLGSTGRPQHQKSTFFRNFQDMKELKKLFWVEGGPIVQRGWGPNVVGRLKGGGFIWDLESGEIPRRLPLTEQLQLVHQPSDLLIIG